MLHLKFDVTPLEELSYYSRKFNVHCLCKRDDLFCKGGGGSKARMLQYILYPLYKEKINVLLTAGGPCSNYNRAAALLCAEMGIQNRDPYEGFLVLPCEPGNPGAMVPP